MFFPAVLLLPIRKTMTRHKDSKLREANRKSRLSGRWTGIGFVIVLLGALTALLLLLGGG